jgi:hypothetical protein
MNAGKDELAMTAKAPSVVPEAIRSGTIRPPKARVIASRSDTPACSSRTRSRKWIPASMPIPMTTVEIRLVRVFRWPSTSCVKAIDQATPHTSGTIKVNTARPERSSKYRISTTPSTPKPPLFSMSSLIVARSSALMMYGPTMLTVIGARPRRARLTVHLGHQLPHLLRHPLREVEVARGPRRVHQQHQRLDALALEVVAEAGAPERGVLLAAHEAAQRLGGRSSGGSRQTSGSALHSS